MIHHSIEFEALCKELNKTRDFNELTKLYNEIITLLTNKTEPEIRASNTIYFLDNFKIPIKCTNEELNITMDNIIEITLLAIHGDTLALCCFHIIKYCNNNDINMLHFNKVENIEAFVKILLEFNADLNTPPHIRKIFGNFLLLVDPCYYDESNVKQLLEILHLNYTDIWEYSSKNIDTKAKIIHSTFPVSFDYKVKEISKQLSHYLFILARMFSSPDIEIGIYFDITAEKFILSLLQVSDFDVLCAASSVFVKLAAFNGTKFSSQIFVKKIFLVVLRVFRLDYVPEESCYRTQMILKDFKVPFDLPPISLIVQLLSINSKFAEMLYDIHFEKTIETCMDLEFSKCHNSMSMRQAYNFAMYLTCLSYMAVINDECKSVIANGTSDVLVKKILEEHVLIISKPNLSSSLYLRVLETSNRLTFAACSFLKSLSRSAPLLRVYFTTDTLSNALLKILKAGHSIDNNLNNIGFYNAEKSLHILILGIISNLIIEFSSTRDYFKVHEILLLIKKYLDDRECDEIVIASLALLRNALFGDDMYFKSKCLEIVTLDRLFSLAASENVDIQIETFNVFRNLLTTSISDTVKINKAFERFSSGQNFVDFVGDFLKESKSNTLTITLLYNLIHLSTSATFIKALICKKNILKHLSYLLNSPKTPYILNDEFWEIKTGIAWIIINLLNSPDLKNDIPYVNDGRNIDGDLNLPLIRCKILMKMGFHDTLKSLAESSKSLDFVERANKAIFQLEILRSRELN